MDGSTPRGKTNEEVWIVPYGCAGGDPSQCRHSPGLVQGERLVLGDRSPTSENRASRCSHNSSTPRRMSASLPPTAPLAAVAQPSRNTPNAPPHGQVVLTREPREFEGVGCGARTVAAHQLEKGRVRCSIRERADMGEIRDPRLHAVDKVSRKASVLGERDPRILTKGLETEARAKPDVGRPGSASDHDWAPPTVFAGPRGIETRRHRQRAVPPVDKRYAASHQ